MKYELNHIYNEDCLQAMKQIPDKFFDLAIVDPPYGINRLNSGGMPKSSGFKTWERKTWDKNPPPDDYFIQLIRVSKNQIIWGGNYFANKLENSMGWIFWFKQKGMTFADGELAWTSFERATRQFDAVGMGGSSGEKRIHPTQKPVALYEWLLNNYAKKGDKILDTHLGSASSIIACKKLGFEYLGFELDENYFNKAKERIEKFDSQCNMFELLNEKQKAEQENLFDDKGEN